MPHPSTSRLRLALETAGLMLSETDTVRGTVTLAPAFAAWLGCDTDIPLADAWEMVHPDDRARVEREFAAAIANGRDLVSEHRLVLPGGVMRWVSVQGTSVRSADGEPSSVFQLVTRDITDRKHVEEQSRFHGAILSQIADAVIAVDNDLRVTYMNGEAERRYGIAARAALGQPIDRLYTRVWREPEEEAAAFRALDTHGHWRGENQHITGDGRTLWVESSVDVLRDDDGRRTGLLAVMRDVSNRKQVELALRESEARFRAMTEQVEVGIGMIAPDGRIVYVNDRYCEIAGRERASLLGLTVRDITHPDDWVGNEPLLRRLMREGAPFTFEKRLVRPDGSVRWTRVTSSARRAPDGRVLGGLAVTIDLTDRRAAEEALRASEERFRFLADSMPQLVWTARDDGQVTYYNSRAALYDGVEDARDDSRFVWRPSLHPDDIAATVACWNSAVADGHAYECEHRVRMADGSYRWHLSRASRVVSGQTAQWFGTATDIHDLKEAQDALRLSEERLRLAADAARFGAYDLDPQRQQVIWSSTLRELMGVSPDEPLTSDTPTALVHPEDRARFVQTMAASLVPEGAGVHDFEFRIVRRDGQVRWMHDTGRTSFEDQDGIRRATRVVGIVQDVTERTRLDLSLRESEERFRIMADECPVIIWVTDARGELQFVNRMYCEYFGVSAPDVRGLGWQPLVHPDDHAYVQALMDAVGARTPFTAEARVRRADGEWRWVASYGTPRYSLGREFLGFVGTSQDVTSQKRARALEEEAVREKDQFIAVLAHELRNPLAPIRTSVALLRARGPADPFLARCRDVIDRQAAHMGRLLDDLLDVSRLSRGKLTLQRAPVPLRSLLEAAVDLSRPLIDQQQHTLTIDADETLVIDVDGARVIQVIGNLLTNAAKYTPRQGRIHVWARRDGDAVRIGVRDTGAGIAPDRLESVFELFTQGEGPGHDAGGLGIGLALARWLVQMHGGTLRAFSRGAGQGSEFIVQLPVGHAGPRSLLEDAPEPKPDRTWSGRRVLVADDNSDAAEMLSAYFAQLGSIVRTVGDGRAAVREVAAFDPDLVLMDIGMPHMDGVEACRSIRAEEWGRRAVIVALTGWGQDEDRRRTAEVGFDLHLVKPADPVELAQRAAAALTLRASERI